MEFLDAVAVYPEPAVHASEPGGGAHLGVQGSMERRQALSLVPANASRFARLRTADLQANGFMAMPLEHLARPAAEIEFRVQRAQVSAREAARLCERARILRDMHDGVGSHISTAIRQLETGNASREEVLHTLRDSLDHLKLSIDTMNQPPGDINALLANLRYRLEPRFLACNIPWHWDVDLLKPIARFDPAVARLPATVSTQRRRAKPRLMDTDAMRQLQFILMEALSNVLQHSQASTVRIAARRFGRKGNGAQLQVIDNGRGFDVASLKRKGLKSMQERADAINAKLVLSSVPGKTVVELTLA